MRPTLIPAVLFIAAGAMHFVRPQMYAKIIPPVMGHEAELVAISGIAEIAGGIGLLIPATRQSAAYGLIALLLAVWPANIFMAVEAKQFAGVAPAWALWLRVPLQLPLIWWIWRVGCSGT
jgi:uncharacterized membrane protein